MPDAYTTLDKVIEATCHKLGDHALRKYAVLDAHAKSWFLADYNPSSGQTLKTALIAVGPDRTAALPDDYLQYVAISRRYGNKLRTLAHNPALSPLPPVEPWLDRAPLGAPVEAAWPAYDLTGWDTGTEGLRSYGWGEYHEEFVVDPVERVLRVSSLIAPDEPLVLQYVSADLCPHKATPLHPAYALTLEYWLLWQMHLRKNEASPAATYERLYHAARRNARAQLDPFSQADLRAIIRQCYNTIR